MFITMVITAALAMYIGVAFERNRWVKTVKDNKVIAVDGNLYKVTKTDVNAG